jgi:hypothetical protein
MVCAFAAPIDDDARLSSCQGYADLHLGQVEEPGGRWRIIIERAGYPRLRQLLRLREALCNEQDASFAVVLVVVDVGSPPVMLSEYIELHRRDPMTKVGPIRCQDTRLGKGPLT